MWTDRQPLRTLSPAGTRRAKQPCAPCGAEPDALADLGCSAPSASWDQADLCRVSSRRATHAGSPGESPYPRRVVAATGSAWCPNQTAGVVQAWLLPCCIPKTNLHSSPCPNCEHCTLQQFLRSFLREWSANRKLSSGTAFSL